MTRSWLSIGNRRRTLSAALADTLVHGRAGVRVILSVNREDFVVARDFSIAREALPIYPVTDTRHGEVLYLKLSYFPEGSATAVAQTLAQKHRAIVFDLRDNPGGLVAEGAKIAEFVP